MTARDRARLRAKWQSDRKKVAEKPGISEESAEVLLDALPYSSIPSWRDVDEVLTAVKTATGQSMEAEDA